MARPPRSEQPAAQPAATEAPNSREAILAAALTTFARDGYDGASMPRIARLAQVAPPLIHYYFGSKERLWQATLEHSLGELRREADAIFAATRALAPLDRLRTLLQVHAHFAARWPDHFAMIVAEARSDSARFEWVQCNFTGPLFDQMLAILHDAREQGAIRAVNLRHIAITLFGGILVHFTVMPHRLPDTEATAAADEYCTTLFDLLLGGIAVRGAA